MSSDRFGSVGPRLWQVVCLLAVDMTESLITFPPCRRFPFIVLRIPLREPHAAQVPRWA